MKTLLAIDGNSILNRAFYGVKPLTTKNGFPTNALYGMVNIIEKQKEALSPDYMVVAFDLKAPTFRHKLYDAYKAGRRPMPDDLRAQFPVNGAQFRLRGVGLHFAQLMLARVFQAQSVQTVACAGEDLSVVAHPLPPLSFLRILSRSS